MGENVTIKILD